MATYASSLIPRTIASLVKPAVFSLASNLFVLTTGRKGSSEYKPTIVDFYETGLVTELYKHLLMCPPLQHLDIRHEMPYQGHIGAPRQVDIWMRPYNGGYPHLIEAGDFSVGKVHRDLRKIRGLNRAGSNWFLAFFRAAEGDPNWKEPKNAIESSFGRTNGLDRRTVAWNRNLTGHFEVYRPDGVHDHFGYALLKRA